MSDHTQELDQQQRGAGAFRSAGQRISELVHRWQPSVDLIGAASMLGDEGEAAGIILAPPELLAEAQSRRILEAVQVLRACLQGGEHCAGPSLVRINIKLPRDPRAKRLRHVQVTKRTRGLIGCQSVKLLDDHVAELVHGVQRIRSIPQQLPDVVLILSRIEFVVEHLHKLKPVGVILVPWTGASTGAVAVRRTEHGSPWCLQLHRAEAGFPRILRLSLRGLRFSGRSSRSGARPIRNLKA
mmetsp:Transcript_11203/g.41821  ORF Transcript_11203/g.41821 Transcript_11203/m.41821 type:complete len:241 (-) Transcript_11203:3898-4620(-)